MTGKTIMIVDDDRGFAQSLANMLGASGYRTCVSYDPASALAQSRSHQVDCALIDYNLGATLGTTLITRLREEGHSFPMIMITGYGDVRTATQAMKLGAADFVEKPYEPGELLASIDGAINRARDSSQVADGIRDARRMLRMLTERESERLWVSASAPSRRIVQTFSRSWGSRIPHHWSALRSWPDSGRRKADPEIDCRSDEG